MKRFSDVQALISSDAARMRILCLVRDLGLPDCWVAAGFVRSRVWDHLHQRSMSPLPQDIDVIWYDSLDVNLEREAFLEQALRARDDVINWSVKNQARMHLRNDDNPYQTSTDAMAHWPETATAVAARLSNDGIIEIAAPFGLNDLFNLVVRPTARFLGEKHSLYLDRVCNKEWKSIWPDLKIQTIS